LNVPIVIQPFARSRPSNDSSLHLFILTSDRGSNELLARKMWLALAKDSPEVLVFLGDCLEHAGHLVSLQALKTADTLLKNQGVQWKYFSSLATSSNTFRDLAKGIFQSWCELHGDVSGLKYAKNIWPKLVAGRWNSCNDVEARMEHIGGQKMIKPVLDRVLASRAKGLPGEKSSTIAAADRGTNHVDEISYEETRQYQGKTILFKTGRPSTGQNQIQELLRFAKHRAWVWEVNFGYVVHG
jgi:hypothetical protein